MEAGGILQDELEVWIVLARLAQHLRRTVEAHHLGTGRGYLSGQLTGAAAEIQNPFTGTGLKQFHQAASELPNVGMLAFVLLRVPGTQAFLPRAFPFLGFSAASGSASGSASVTASGTTSGTAAGPAAARTSLNSSAFLRSFLEGGACSLR